MFGINQSWMKEIHLWMERRKQLSLSWKFLKIWGQSSRRAELRKRQDLSTDVIVSRETDLCRTLALPRGWQLHSWFLVLTMVRWLESELLPQGQRSKKEICLRSTWLCYNYASAIHFICHPVTIEHTSSLIYLTSRVNCALALCGGFRLYFSKAKVSLCSYGFYSAEFYRARLSWDKKDIVFCRK